MNGAERGEAREMRGAADRAGTGNGTLDITTSCRVTTQLSGAPQFPAGVRATTAASVPRGGGRKLPAIAPAPVSAPAAAAGVIDRVGRAGAPPAGFP